MSLRCNDDTKRPKLQDIQARDLVNLCILQENSAESLGFRR